MHNPIRDDNEESSSLALVLGECIGAESCVDLRTDLSDLENQILSANKTRRKIKRYKKIAEYPPPIPWLARTENPPNSQLPWVMKRYYTDDGRLIIREEKVERHDYFQAHRANGRLTLRLVPLTIDESDDFDYEEEGKIVNVHDECEEDRVVDGLMAEEEGETSSLNNSSSAEESNCMDKCGGGGGRSSCMFGMSLPSFRPVRI